MPLAKTSTNVWISPLYIVNDLFKKISMHCVHVCKIIFNNKAMCLFSDKLDGLRTGTKRKRDWEAIASRMEDYLQLPDDYDSRASEPGKKRVRWADLEEKKDADRKRAIGFVVGQTDWEKITDESGHFAEKALNRTKYI
uniref:YLP motif-containing protein 1 n=1 Tax=Micrurus spixii TaxID=129469 RepID=A0A2D4LNZ4_9SAUR